MNSVSSSGRLRRSLKSEPPQVRTCNLPFLRPELQGAGLRPAARPRANLLKAMCGPSWGKTKRFAPFNGTFAPIKNMSDTPSELVSVPTLSQMLEIPEKTIRRWVWRREIPYHKLGRLVRFNVEEIQAWCEARKVRPLSGLTVNDRMASHG